MNQAETIKQLKEKIKHAGGVGCNCFAYGESECGCYADWTPKKVYEQQVEVLELKERVAELEKDKTIRTNMINDLEDELQECKEELNGASLYPDVTGVSLIDDIRDLKKAHKEKEAHCLELVTKMKRLKLEFAANVCECGESWDESDASAIVEEALNSPTTKRYEAMLRVVEKAKMFINSKTGDKVAERTFINSVIALEEALIHLKHNKHHSIEEELWRIDKALSTKQGECDEHTK